MNVGSALEFLREMPGFIGTLVGNLAAKDLRWKPAPQEFSLLEHVCHLRDIEREGYSTRIDKLLHESEPFLPDIDGDKLAKDRDYNNQVIDEALVAFTQARLANIQAIKAFTPSDLKRIGVFENSGTITLERLVVMMYEHDQNHRQALHDLAKRLAGAER